VVKNIKIPLSLDIYQQDKIDELVEEYTLQCVRLIRTALISNTRGRKSLHALMYKVVKDTSTLGSQMICNAIAQAYTEVTCPAKRLGRDPRPVMYDKNTCSVGEGVIRLYTPRGRIRITCPEITTMIVSKGYLYKDETYVLDLEIFDG